MLPYLEVRHLFNSINHDVFVMSFVNDTAEKTLVGQFICPSDPETATGMTNYGACLGDGQGKSLGVFGSYRSYDSESCARLASISDGLANTVAMSEFLVGSWLRFDRRRSFYKPVGWPDAGPHQSRDEFANRCSTGRAMEPDVSRELSLYKGFRWMAGMPNWTLYDHTMKMGQPSCFNTVVSMDPPRSATASSDHVGGVNCLFADGHVILVKDSIQLPAWRALATRSGGEVVDPGAY